MSGGGGSGKLEWVVYTGADSNLAGVYLTGNDGTVNSLTATASDYLGSFTWTHLAFT
jgi:hypothetical protein